MLENMRANNKSLPLLRQSLLKAMLAFSGSSPIALLSVVLLSALCFGAGSVWSYEIEKAFGPWEKIIFDGEVTYTKENDPARGEVIRAKSYNAASGLMVNHVVDLNKTPFLHWSWKLEKSITSTAEEQSKAGDDFSVRVYVVAKGFFPWQTKAISYIWSRQYPVGTVWDNPYTRNSKMLVVESGSSRENEWVNYVRDVKQDYQSLFSKNIRQLHGVAIMSDTDDTDGVAIALYGPYWFNDEAN